MRTRFDVLGLEGQVLGLEDCKSSKMPCPRPRTALFFDLLKMGQGHGHFLSLSWSTPETSWKFMKIFFLEDARIFAENLQFFKRRISFLETICKIVSLSSRIPVFGLERVCPREVGPWPRIFFVFGLEPGALDSTSDARCVACRYKLSS